MSDSETARQGGKTTTVKLYLLTKWLCATTFSWYGCLFCELKCSYQHFVSGSTSCVFTMDYNVWRSWVHNHCGVEFRVIHYNDHILSASLSTPLICFNSRGPPVWDDTSHYRVKVKITVLKYCNNPNSTWFKVLKYLILNEVQRELIHLQFALLISWLWPFTLSVEPTRFSKPLKSASHVITFKL